MSEILNVKSAGYVATLQGTYAFITVMKAIIIFMARVAAVMVIWYAFDPEFLKGAIEEKSDVVWMCVALTSFLFIYLFLNCVGKIIKSAQFGDPFIRENAQRIRALGWLFLIIGIFVLADGVTNDVQDQVAKGSSLTEVYITNTFASLIMNPAVFLASPLMFILARVFDAGIAMREDVEGTI